jgi:hypothetical protein
MRRHAWSSLAGIALAGWLASACASAPAEERPNADERFAGLLERMERGEAVDFVELRRASVDAGRDAPGGLAAVEARAEAMREALRAGDFGLAGRRADEILAQLPLYPEAHLAAAVAARELGDQARAAHHGRIVRGLFESICGELDGRDPARPCWVAAAYEASFYLGQRGLVLEAQRRGRCGGQVCDILSVVDPATDERFELHFAPSRPIGRRNTQLEY